MKGMDVEALEQSRGFGSFERYLTVRVVLCIVSGIFLGKAAPGTARWAASCLAWAGILTPHADRSAAARQMSVLVQEYNIEI